MNVAVTGATGFIGGHIVRRLVNDGHTVYAFGRRPPDTAVNLGGPEYRSWDITAERLRDIPAVGAVVHCAANVSDWGAYGDLYRTNVEGTRVVLETFRNASRFVHISSASVYDPRTPKVMVRESAELPSTYFNAYGKTKMLAECLLARARRPVIILRPHAVYGPNDTTVLPRLLKARRFGRLVLVGDGRNHISLTHIDNLVDATVQAMTGPCDHGVFNICDELAPTLDDAVRCLFVALRLGASVHYMPTRVAWPMARSCEALYAAARISSPPPITRYLISQVAVEYTLDTEQARLQLGYRPTVDYRSGLATVTVPPECGH